MYRYISNEEILPNLKSVKGKAIDHQQAYNRFQCRFAQQKLPQPTRKSWSYCSQKIIPLLN